MKICKQCNHSFYIKKNEGNKRFNKRIFCSKSCAMIFRQTTHGFGHNKFYNTFMNIKARCNNKKASNYYLYGNRGIKCKWQSFIEFRNNMYESYLEHIKEFGEKNTSIDRINNNGNYCKENCRWATAKQQARNTNRSRFITFNNETHCIAEWGEITGISYKIIGQRLIRNKWSIEKTLTTLIK